MNSSKLESNNLQLIREKENYQFNREPFNKNGVTRSYLVYTVVAELHYVWHYSECCGDHGAHSQGAGTPLCPHSCHISLVGGGVQC